MGTERVWLDLDLDLDRTGLNWSGFAGLFWIGRALRLLSWIGCVLPGWNWPGRSGTRQVGIAMATDET